MNEWSKEIDDRSKKLDVNYRPPNHNLYLLRPNPQKWTWPRSSLLLADGLDGDQGVHGLLVLPGGWVGGAPVLAQHLPRGLDTGGILAGTLAV